MALVLPARSSLYCMMAFLSTLKTLDIKKDRTAGKVIPEHLHEQSAAFIAKVDLLCFNDLF